MAVSRRSFLRLLAAAPIAAAGVALLPAPPLAAAAFYPPLTIDPWQLRELEAFANQRAQMWYDMRLALAAPPSAFEPGIICYVEHELRPLFLAPRINPPIVLEAKHR